MNVNSFEGLEDIRDILDFMGFTTAQSVAKLRKDKELCTLQLEVGKLRSNAKFCEKYPHLKDVDFGLGKIQVLKDVALAASFCTSFTNFDSQTVQKIVFERCKSVRKSCWILWLYKQNQT